VIDVGEAKYELDIRITEKPFKIPKDKLSGYKGVISGRKIAYMKKEAVSCPVKGEAVPFLECYDCENFMRRMKGKVHCSGEPLKPD